MFIFNTYNTLNLKVEGEGGLAMLLFFDYLFAFVRVSLFICVMLSLPNDIVSWTVICDCGRHVSNRKISARFENQASDVGKA